MPLTTEDEFVLALEDDTIGDQTLFSITYELAKILGNVVDGTATGGGTTTLIDTAAFDAEADDYWNNGTIWIHSGVNASKTAIITNWDNASKTWTFDPALAAVVATVTYSVATADYPRYILRQAVNRALKEMGSVEDVNTALSTTSNTETYTLPTGVSNIKRVEIGINSSTPIYYYVHSHWYEKDGLLWFDPGYMPDAGYTIRLTYAPLTVTTLDSDTATFSDLIHPDAVIWAAAVFALRWRLQKTQDNEPERVRYMNEAIARAEANASKFKPPTNPQKDAHFGGW
jgi:hypothetical protein